MKSFLKYTKVLNSTPGVLFLTICWMIAFICFIGFAKLDENETEIKNLFIPERIKNPTKKNDNNNNNHDEIRENSFKKNFERLKFENLTFLENSKNGNLSIKTENNKPVLTEKQEKNQPEKPELLDFTEKNFPKNKDTFTGTNTTTVIPLMSKLNEKKIIYDKDNNEIMTSQLQSDNYESRKISTRQFSINNYTAEPHIHLTIVAKPNDPKAPGEGGKPFQVNKNEFSDSEKLEYENGWKNHQFNLFASDRISVRRSIPDRRSRSCQEMNYKENLPTTSVVIVFHNEAWSTLLRTVHSIIDRSPEKLIKEIILVDDASTFDNLKSKLDQYMKLLKIVKIKRTKSRIGLMKARIIGAEGSLGEVLTFLDAHVECYPGWLEPMLSRIVQNNKTVVTPVIDSISDETFQPTFLSDNSISIGIFDWAMQFNWKLPQSNERLTPESPIKSPAMAGGLFSISRKYFYELGTYDPGMKIWGSENVEMSLRIWMCGGNLEIIPCSRVGHVFRSNSPYNWEESIDKILTVNQRRLVEVWLDEYKEVYYAVAGNRNKYDIGDILDRVKLRKRLKCNSFDWYLKNIFPTLFNPFKGHFMGSIESVAFQGNCIDSGDENSNTIKLYPCHNLGGNQIFVISQNGFLRTLNKCFSDGELQIYNCDHDPNESGWKYNDQKNIIFNDNHLCLSGKSNDHIVIKKCAFDIPNINQQWIFKSHVPFKLPLQDNDNNNENIP